MEQLLFELSSDASLKARKIKSIYKSGGCLNGRGVHSADVYLRFPQMSGLSDLEMEHPW